MRRDMLDAPRRGLRTTAAANGSARPPEPPAKRTRGQDKQPRKRRPRPRNDGDDDDDTDDDDTPRRARRAAPHRAPRSCTDGAPGCRDDLPGDLPGDLSDDFSGDLPEGAGSGRTGLGGPPRNYLAAYLERRWRDASFVCPQLPRARPLAAATEAIAAAAVAEGLSGGGGARALRPGRVGAAAELGGEDFVGGDEVGVGEFGARGAERRQHAAGFVDDGAWRAARQPAACQKRRRGQPSPVPPLPHAPRPPSALLSCALLSWCPPQQSPRDGTWYHPWNRRRHRPKGGPQSGRLARPVPGAQRRPGVPRHVV